jgi:hypothetical protein
MQPFFLGSHDCLRRLASVRLPEYLRLKLHRLADEIGEIAGTDTLHHSSPVILHRLGADVELSSDLLAGEFGNDQLHYFALVGREAVKTRLQFIHLDRSAFAQLSTFSTVAYASK